MFQKKGNQEIKHNFTFFGCPLWHPQKIYPKTDKSVVKKLKIVFFSNFQVTISSIYMIYPKWDPINKSNPAGIKTTFIPVERWLPLKLRLSISTHIYNVVFRIGVVRGTRWHFKGGIGQRMPDWEVNIKFWAFI